MLRACAILSLTFVAVALGATPRVEAKPEPAPATIKVGIMNGMFKGIPEPLIKAGGHQFSSLFQKFTGLPGGVEGEEEYADLAKKLKDNQIQLGVVHGFEWSWISKQHPQLAALVVAVPSKLPQSCIVVNVKNEAVGLVGLKGAKVEIPFNMKAHGFLYIEKLHKSCPPGSFTPTTPEELGPDEALDELVKGKTVAALVDQSTLQGYQKNNPGKSMKLKVLASSEVFPPTVIIYNAAKGGLDEQAISKIRTGMLNASKDAQGKAFLFLWNLKGFEEPSPAFAKLVEDCVKAYPPPARK